MPQVILPRLLLKGASGPSVLVDPGSIIDVLTAICVSHNIPRNIFFKDDATLSGGIALFCNGVCINNNYQNLNLKDSDMLEIVLAISGG